MTKPKYNPKNIFYAKVLEHKSFSILICFSATGDLLPVSDVTKKSSEVADRFKGLFSKADPNTVLIVDPVTARKYSVPNGKCISPHVDLVVPYVYQWVEYGRSTGENYKKLNYPFQTAQKLLDSGSPMHSAIEQGFWNAKLKRAWDGINLSNFAQELDCIKTDIKFMPFYDSFYRETVSQGRNWSAKFMTDPVHLNWKKQKIACREGLENGTISPSAFFSKGWWSTSGTDIKVKQTEKAFADGKGNSYHLSIGGDLHVVYNGHW